MGMEGGLSLVRTIILVIIAAILLISLAQVVTGKTEELGCSWASQLVDIFEPLFNVFGSTPPSDVC